MFTGIVTAIGRIAARERADDRLRLRIEAPYADLVTGESVAVAGACLTVTDHGTGWFAVDAVVTTRGRTRLGSLAVGDAVNLERALAIGDRLGGHFVQGHVDALGDVTAVRESADSVLIDIAVPADVAAVTVLHGSITIDGVSLTVNAFVDGHAVQVALIPFTREHTTLGALQVGDQVHVEGDLLGKFVQQAMHVRADAV